MAGAMSSVQWGTREYNASTHAVEALRGAPVAGDRVLHSDDSALIEAAADRLIDLHYTTWGFGDSVSFEGLLSASEHLGSDRWARFAHGWARAWATRSQPFVRLDCTAPGAAMVHLARSYEDAQLLDAVHLLGDYLADRPRLHGVFQTWDSSPLLAPYSQATLSERDVALLRTPPAGVFVDCLHFDPPFFAALGGALGDERFARLASEQALGYVNALQQANGLFGHFVLEGDNRVFGVGWGRGQGWALLGLLDTIQSLSDSGADGAEVLLEALTRSVEAMLSLQRDDGAWFAVVDRPESGDETSTAAFMTVVLRRAAAMGVGDPMRLNAAADRARETVLDSLDGRGSLRGVSAAVYASTELSHYDRVPRGFVVPWGQGPAVLALVAGGER